MASSENVVNCSEEIVRPEANFPPSIWGDRFMNYTPDALLAKNYATGIDGLKGEVKHMLSECGSSMVETMKLIDTLERLGISYHFQNEIELKLEQFYNLGGNYEDESYDLQAVALHFRLFRQHGYRVSCDIFRKFMDSNQKFQNGLKRDARGLLSLYQAAHLRVREEVILEEAIVFSTANLKVMAPHLESGLRKQVDHALMQPMHFGIARIEILKFISYYEEDEFKNASLLMFAKLDYNLLQMLHRQELCELSRWWKDLDLVSKLPHTRDRLAECYFWALSTYHEPQHSRARIMFTKTVIITSVIDDTYDSYGTIKELEIFANIIQRWDIQEIDHLPVYMKPLYKTILELYEQFNAELVDEGRSYALGYAIKEV